MNRKIVLIAHNIRSTHNVGALFRTSEGLGINKIYLSGYTPYPLKKNDTRLPHIAKKLDDQIHKTALGAEKNLSWEYVSSPEKAIADLKKIGFTIAALEQDMKSQDLTAYQATEKIALILGEEVNGINSEILKLCDIILEIPMYGQKESFNVSVAAAMGLYHFRFC